MLRILVTTLLLCLMPPLFAADIETGDPALDAAFAQILDRDFDVKGQGITALADSKHPKRGELLRGIADGELRYLNENNRLVWMREQGDDTVAVDALSGEDYGAFSTRKFKKLALNNAMRNQIDALLAKINLSDPDPTVRLNAVNAMLDHIEPRHAELFSGLVTNEPDAKVREAMLAAIALSSLSDPDAAQRRKAVASVAGSLEPAVRNGLTRLANNDPDESVRREAAAALKKIQARAELFGYAETLFFGLSLGSVLVLAAIGLAITFGVMGVINMAHGELIMLGAYTTYLIQLALPGMTGLSILLAVPAAFLVSGAVGVAIERGVIRFLYGRPLETLLATFGISLILQQLVRSVISPQNVPVSNPDFLSGSLQINSVLSLTYNRLYIFAFCLLVFAGLFFVLKRTRLGLQVRAVSQNRAMARAMGVRSARVDALTFGLGSGIAGIAGVALSQLTNVGPNLGQAYIVDSFMVVVFGGVGNLWGTLIGGLGLGIANKLMEPWAGAVLAKILVLVFIILFIQKRPRGLFPQKGRAAEG
ncbi:MAG: urea ABC transporter permease subunit UrtB [Chromatiaceae bacterium]|jgi:urea transport system permease protein|nr:urea ABC transporter permease subunit UrtB [Chromatiaceae bacterium]